MIFKARTATALKKRYGKFAKRRRKIDEKDVPESLRRLIPYAEIWGVGDDYEREEAVDAAPNLAIDDLVAIFSDKTVYRDFNEWLGNPSGTNIYTSAYQGFSDLRLSYHSVKALREWETDSK